MRSTTVGWLTLILRVRPVNAVHMWLKRLRPELRDNISHPIEPTQRTPRSSPPMRAAIIAAEDRAGLEGREAVAEAGGISLRLSPGKRMIHRRAHKSRRLSPTPGPDYP